MVYLISDTPFFVEFSDSNRKIKLNSAVKTEKFMANLAVITEKFS